MPASCPATPGWTASRSLMAWALATASLPAWATSAEAHGPVELRLQGPGGLPCAYVRNGAPHEARQGWSIQLWAGPQGAEATGAPAWQVDASAGRPDEPPWPGTASACIALPARALKTGLPNVLEISSIRLYRSRFCWQGPRHGQPARLMSVDEVTLACSPRAWVGQDGHALTTRGWWDAWREWWGQWWREWRRD